MTEQTGGSAANPMMAQCKGTCRQSKPVTGLGSDGMCLDCRLLPVATYQPPLSSTQRRKRAGLPRWSGYRQEED